MIINDLCKMSKEELYEKLTTVYQKQKLSRTANLLARFLDLIIVYIIFVNTDSMITKILIALTGIYSAFKVFNPHFDDKEIFADLEEVTNLFEKYKDYQKGKIDIKLSEKELKNLTHNIEERLPVLLKISILNKCKAFIPFVNIMGDELDAYRQVHHVAVDSSVLYKLLNNGIGRVGLRALKNDNEDLELTEDEEAEPIEEEKIIIDNIENKNITTNEEDKKKALN